MARIAKKDVVMHRIIEFVLEMPKAQKVILVGDFNHVEPQKNTPCAKTKTACGARP